MIIDYCLMIICLAPAAAKESASINAFSAGEISGKLEARSDVQKYYSGCRVMENFFPKPQGGAVKRPGTYYIDELYEIIPGTPAVPEVAATYNFTYISASGGIWGIPVGDGVMAGLDADDAVNIGGGVVGLPYTGHPFTVGESIRITSTTKYNGTFTVLAGTTANQIQITDSYAAETFDGTEVIVKYYGSLAAGEGHMVQDSSGNLYYGHNNVSDGTHYFITRIAPDGTKTPDYLWLNRDPGDPWTSAWGTVNGLAITPDDRYLYTLRNYGRGYVTKWDLTTGDRVWRSVYDAVYTVWPGYDMAIDADGNAYAPFGNGEFVIKFDSDDGSKTVITLPVPATGYTIHSCPYDIKIDDDAGKCVVSGRAYQELSHYDFMYNMVIMDLDGTNQIPVCVGDTYETEMRYTPVIGTTHVATRDGYIYVRNSSGGYTPTIYKYDFEGNLIKSAAGPPYQQGLYFDLYGNLVVINQYQTVGQTDVFWFYDTDLNYLSKIDGFYSTMLSSWAAAIGGSHLSGDAVFDGILGSAGVEAVPDVRVDLEYGETSPFRLISFLQPDREPYVMEFGNEYIAFHKETR